MNERFPSIPDDAAIDAFVAANPQYVRWQRHLVVALMMSLESDRRNPILALRQENERNVQYEIAKGRRHRWE